jgi:hypothetical protein
VTDDGRRHRWGAWPDSEECGGFLRGNPNYRGRVANDVDRKSAEKLQPWCPRFSPERRTCAACECCQVYQELFSKLDLHAKRFEQTWNPHPLDDPGGLSRPFCAHALRAIAGSAPVQARARYCQPIHEQIAKMAYSVPEHHFVTRSDITIDAVATTASYRQFTATRRRSEGSRPFRENAADNAQTGAHPRAALN